MGDYLAERERERDWPLDKDPYAWNYLTPGCLRIGFGFIGWEVHPLSRLSYW